MAAAKLLAGKLALVTGSTSGIGLQIARSLGSAGANLVVHGLVESTQAAQQLKDSLQKELDVKVAVSTHDLSKAENAKRLVDFVGTEMGALDILVNNAGIQHISPVEKFPEEKWDQILAINLSSCFHLVKHSLPSMKAKGYGRIINIASVHGHVASVNKSAYVAAKHGLVGFTKAVALETAGTGVTSNSICPGWVLTPLVQAQIDLRAANTGKSKEEAQRELLLEKQPSGQFVQPSDLGALAVFMCSPAANQMTGVNIPVDGGWTSQ